MAGTFSSKCSQYWVLAHPMFHLIDYPAYFSISSYTLRKCNITLSVVPIDKTSELDVFGFYESLSKFSSLMARPKSVL